MSNIRDAEDAILEAKAEVEEVVKEILKEWYQPVGDLMLAAVWANIPDPVKDQLKKMNPKPVGEIEDAVQRMGGG